MKKYLFIIIICFAQNTFSQSKPTIISKSSIDSDGKTKKTEFMLKRTCPGEKINQNNEKDKIVKPEFPGGINELYSFIRKNYRIPKVQNLKGRVYVTFYIEKDGSLTNIIILRDIGYGTGGEAIRVLKKSPKWIPATQYGKPIKYRYSLPIPIN